jgi:glycosyltransferase involved in cell wall biosynthesis
MPAADPSLVITTYERPDALALVLASVAAQVRAPAEIIVADDGSGPATTDLIARFAARSPRPVRIVRQEHAGFRVARLRNLAIAAARSELLLFVDGDMVLHPRFVEDHLRSARRGWFTQGVRVPLDAGASARLLAAPAVAALQSPPLPGALAPGLGALRRLHALHCAALQLPLRRAGNALIAIKSCNLAVFREDLIAVDGFDESFEGWGPEDKDLCARLQHGGTRRQSLLFGAIAFHLHHPPAARGQRAANERLYAGTLASRRVRAVRGLAQHAGALQASNASHVIGVNRP